MVFSLRPLCFMKFLQNNNHQAVNKMKNSMKPWGRRLNSMALNINIIHIYYHYII